MERKDFTGRRSKVTFVDLFAGAGGISEGFLQASTPDKCYDFLLASDINANCELTHRARYNEQLGLPTAFIRQDIMDDTFLPALLRGLGGRRVDVVTGGPSCQSFSLAGRRRRNDKRDDLFHHYLKVIRALRPKYFVMENVKGILTKDGGRIGRRILSEIRSIVDPLEADGVASFAEERLAGRLPAPLLAALAARLRMEGGPAGAARAEAALHDGLDRQLRALTARHVSYAVSKSDEAVNTARHGLLLLRERARRAELTRQVAQLKAAARVDNDRLAARLDDMADAVSDETLTRAACQALDDVARLAGREGLADTLKESLRALSMTFDECAQRLRGAMTGDGPLLAEFDARLDRARLYRTGSPIVALAADYGVPQNRERVLFIGCRRDQDLITAVPPTVARGERVTVREALWDLDTLGNGGSAERYATPSGGAPGPEAMRPRDAQGAPWEDGVSYAEWSRRGRLSHRFEFSEPPFYVASADALAAPGGRRRMELFNHQASLQSDKVRARLGVIVDSGGYDEAREELRARGLDSAKRNYSVLDPGGQSPTVCTMPDDFIHYSARRPLTVREMARLQSFDDTFVFQGKRQTGGGNRQREIPQYTLVGNAVPPLMARAIGNVILEHIK